MRKIIAVSITAGAILLATGSATAADTIGDKVKKACNTELTTFCKGVMPGEGRILACLYAFEDQVSDKCVYALYDAATDLDKAITALKYAASQCAGDLDKFCADVPLGQGRGLACLTKHDKDVSQACKDALAQTGMKVEKKN